MPDNHALAQVQQTVKAVLPSGPDMRTLAIFLLALLCAYLVNRLLSAGIPYIAKFLTRQSENTTSNSRMLRIQRMETFLSIGVALLRSLVILLALYIAWRLITPQTAPIAIVGASAFFIVLAGATIAPLLRDITSGVLMMAEQWYNVGDHITVDPFWELSGVVERITLRTTKLRSLNGEVVWLHNQYIQGVRVTTRGLRTMAIDTFVTDLEIGKKVVDGALKTLPIGPTMITSKVTIGETEQISEGLWRITVIGQTAPGRDWMLQDFTVNAIVASDKARKGDSVIAYGPIARYADALAEYRLKRSTRSKA